MLWAYYIYERVIIWWPAAALLIFCRRLNFPRFEDICQPAKVQNCVNWFLLSMEGTTFYYLRHNICMTPKKKYIWSRISASQPAKVQNWGEISCKLVFVIYGSTNNILYIYFVIYVRYKRYVWHQRKSTIFYCANVLCPFESDSIKLTAQAEYSCQACSEKNCRARGSLFLKKIWKQILGKKS